MTRLRGVLAAVAASLASSLAASGAASASIPAQVDPSGDAVQSCQGVTCTIYFTRSYTKNVLYPVASPVPTGATGALTGLCLAISRGVGGTTGCGAFAATLSGNAVAAINQAASNNQCVAIYTNVIFDWSWWGTENGDFCLP